MEREHRLLLDDGNEQSSALFAGRDDVVQVDDPHREIDRLHEMYADRLLGFAQGMLRSREDAEDAVQTTFLNAFNSLVDGTVPRQELSWLYRIARNVCLNRIRTRARKQAGSLGDVEVAATQMVDDTVEQLLHVRALRVSIDRLPENQRTALVMRELQGASYREIAAALETTQAAVESLLYRARRQLAAALTPPAEGGLQAA